MFPLLNLMDMSKQDIVDKLLSRHGKTFCKETGIPIEKGTPAPLFQWLFTANLFSARISSSIAVDAAKGLIEEGLTTPEKMKNTSWERRVRVLNQAHYTRYQERTATFLGELSEHLLEAYKGDLNKLREEAGGNQQKLREVLKEIKGMGEVGVDIFFREVQTAWKELYPFADKKALQAAQKLGLPKEADKLADLVSRKDFPALLAALIRVDLENDYQLEGPEKGREKKKEADALSAKTKEELYEKAKKQHIPGRSKMSKKELSKAIKEHS